MGSRIKLMGGACRTFFFGGGGGGRICSLVPLKVLKSKMTTVRLITVPLMVLSWKNRTELVPLWGKKLFKPRPPFWYLLECFSKISDDHSRHFYMEYPPNSSG